MYIKYNMKFMAISCKTKNAWHLNGNNAKSCYTSGFIPQKTANHMEWAQWSKALEINHLLAFVHRVGQSNHFNFCSNSYDSNNCFAQQSQCVYTFGQIAQMENNFEYWTIKLRNMFRIYQVCFIFFLHQLGLGAFHIVNVY